MSASPAPEAGPCRSSTPVGSSSLKANVTTSSAKSLASRGTPCTPSVTSISVCSAPICRICHEPAGPSSSEALISPCQCSGSLASIHRRCLERWLSTRAKDDQEDERRRCEICGFAFKVRSKPKSFKEWMLSSGSSCEQRSFVTDVICFFVLTPLAVTTAFLCISSLLFENVTEVESKGLMVMATFVLALYAIWFFLTIRLYVVAWRQWTIRNQNVQLIDVSVRRTSV